MAQNLVPFKRELQKVILGNSSSCLTSDSICSAEALHQSCLPGAQVGQIGACKVPHAGGGPCGP